MNEIDKPLEQLLKESQDGSRESYELLLRSVLPFLRKYVAVLSRGSISQEDALQEILLTIHRALHTYLYPNPVLPWLKAIARNKIIDLFRSSARDKVLDSDQKLDESQSLLFSMNQVLPEDLADLKRIWATLSAKEQELLQLVKIEGFSFSQLAEHYKEEEGALKVRVHRIIKKLRERALKELKSGSFTMFLLMKFGFFLLLVLQLVNSPG